MVVNHFGSFSNKIDGLHQQIVVKVFIEVEQKAHTHLSQSEGNNQSGKVENEVFEEFSFLLNLNFNMIKGREVRSRIVIFEVCLGVIQLFGVDEFEILSPNIVKCRPYFIIFILIIDKKDPYFSEVKEVSPTVPTPCFHLYIFGVVLEGKADLTYGGRLLVCGCIDNIILV